MIMNIYKPRGLTSFDVVAKVRKALDTKKVGHAGTLDPLAEGVLIVLTDQDTKKQNEFMGLEKEYIAYVAFGATSPSYDLETDLEYRNHRFDLHQLENEIKQVLPNFIGEIKQRVPAYSAVKVKGKRLYKKARSGEINEDEIPTKTVKVKNIELMSVSHNTDFNLPLAKIKITTGSGFYVRSFAHDLGEMLATGAVLVGLLRSRVGEFSSEESKDISSLST